MQIPKKITWKSLLCSSLCSLVICRTLQKCQHLAHDLWRIVVFCSLQFSWYSSKSCISIAIYFYCWVIFYYIDTPWCFITWSLKVNLTCVQRVITRHIAANIVYKFARDRISFLGNTGPEVSLINQRIRMFQCLLLLFSFQCGFTEWLWRLIFPQA